MIILVNKHKLVNDTRLQPGTAIWNDLARLAEGYFWLAIRGWNT